MPSRNPCIMCSVDSAWSWKVRALRCRPVRYTLQGSYDPEPSITTVVLADHLHKWEGGENTGGGAGQKDTGDGCK